MRSLRSRLVGALCALALCIVAAVPAFAQGGGWAAPSIDWTGRTQTAVTSLGGVVTSVLPVAVTIFAILIGVGLLFKMVRRAAK